MAASFSGNRLEAGIHSCGYSELLKQERKIQEVKKVDANAFVQSVSNVRLLIDGLLVPSVDGHVFGDRSPITNLILLDGIARANLVDVDQAVAAASRACKDRTWKRTPIDERAQLLFIILEKLTQNEEELTMLEAIDSGTPISMCRHEHSKAIQIIKYYATSFANHMKVGSSRALGSRFSYSVREAIGVVAAILSWRSTLCSMMMVLCPAIICGDAVVFKISESAPLLGLKVASILLDCGLPRGLVNVLTGPGATVGSHLMLHRDVSRIVFYGHSAVARAIQDAIHRSAAQHPDWHHLYHSQSRLNVDRVGKACACVLKDCDVAFAAKQIAKAAFLGQSASGLSLDKVVVQRSIYESFLEHLQQEAAAIKIGEPLDENMQLGPMANRQGFFRARDCISHCLSEGAKLCAGGFPDLKEAQGYFLRPTIIRDVTMSMKICCEQETAGPLLLVIPCEVDDAATDAEAACLSMTSELGKKSSSGMCRYLCLFAGNNSLEALRCKYGVELGHFCSGMKEEEKVQKQSLPAAGRSIEVSSVVETAVIEPLSCEILAVNTINTDDEISIRAYHTLDFYSCERMLTYQWQL